MEIVKNWFHDYKKLTIWSIAVLVLIIIGFTLFKGKTSLGRLSKETVYTPTSDKGFILKANNLLQALVDQGNNEHADIRPRSMAELQRRYPALRFALPYGESNEGGARASDIRLVGIVADSIRSEKDRDFYYNSDIPKLLQRQLDNLGDRMFRISFASTSTNSHGLTITCIRVQPGMFRVALDKQRWTGDIFCAENALFPDSTHCFLVWGQTSVPIRLRPMGDTRRGMLKVVKPNPTTHQLETSEANRSHTIDYFNLYKAYQSDSTTLCLRLPGSNDCGIYLDYVTADSISIKAVGCYCQPYGAQGALTIATPKQPYERGQRYAIGDHLRLVISRTPLPSAILCEATIVRQSPMRILSTQVRSRAGLKRHNMAASQTDRFTQQILRGLATTMNDEVCDTTITISIDPLLSREMEKELKLYTDNVLRNKKDKNGNRMFYDDDHWEVSLTVMDMATGAVVAAPYYRTTDRSVDYDLAISRKNPALIRRYIGSTFKPLVALAAVLTDPSLLNLTTVGDYHLDKPGDGKKDKGRATFYNHPTTAWSSFGSAADFWKGCPSMEKFISNSDDVYPVALVAKALGMDRQVGNPFVYTTHEVRLRERENFTWAHAPFISTLTHLYSIPSPMDYNLNDSLQMEYYTWENMRVDSTSRFGLDNVSPDPTLLYYDNFNSPAATLQNELSTWVLGQGSNEWNCLKLAEAWSRLLTKRKVRTSFVVPRQSQRPEDLTKGYDTAAWNSFLEILRNAQDKGSLLPRMQNAISALNRSENIADSLILFGKTGTPENYLREEWKTVQGRTYWLDMGLYCMGLMPASSYQSVRSDNGGSGLMCVVCITRLSNHADVTRVADKRGIQSSDAREFFASNQQRLRKFYTLAKPYLAPMPPTSNNPQSQQRK